MSELHDALPASALSLARVLGQSPDCVKLLDQSGRVLWMNENGLCAMEIDALSDIAGRAWPSLWPASQQESIEATLNDSARSGLANHSGPCPTAKGLPRWWDVAVHPLQDEGGAPIGFISVSRDVTDRENQRIALETMVAEMRHRLKNSYTLVCSLMSGLARGDEDLCAFADDFQRRVMALAKAQSLFSGRNELSSLNALIPNLVAPFQEHENLDIVLNLSGMVSIDARTADAIALTLGEFAVNSAKHGAFRLGGAVTISAVADGCALRISWVETINGTVAATNRDGGQGLNLIKRMLAANSAKLELEWHERGLTADVSFSRGYLEGAADPRDP